jgi:hypothetical protein
LKSVAVFGGLTGEPLIVVDDEDAVHGPTHGGREVLQGVLPLARFPMIEDLLRIRLTDVDDGQQTEVPIGDQIGPLAT